MMAGEGGITGVETAVTMAVILMAGQLMRG